MSIMLLINSTLYPGSVFLGELHCLAINLVYENLQVIEYGHTALLLNERALSIWYFGCAVLKRWKKLRLLIVQRVKSRKFGSLNGMFES